MSSIFNKERLHIYECLELLKRNSFDFDVLALKIFHFQYKYNQIYRSYVDNLGIDPIEVLHKTDIPFLPISGFKHHSVLVDHLEPEITFTSSGTSQSQRSQHQVVDLQFYLDNTRYCFESLFDDTLSDFTFLALLPSYMDRAGSSLIEMMKYFIAESGSTVSGFYHESETEMIEHLKELETTDSKVILIGVSYALLDLIDIIQLQLKNTIILETGGMKGRREELSKEVLHDRISKGLGVKSVGSEYGMTELLSQCYSFGAGLFIAPSIMDIEMREINDPLAVRPLDRSGQMYITDLANIDSCAFIATDDIGIKRGDRQFEILGRIDHSDRRGCNLLIEELTQMNEAATK